MPITERSDTPPALTMLLVVAWAITLAFAGNLLLCLSGVMTQDLFAQHVGHFSWVVYMWIASTSFWRRAVGSERRALVRFVRWVLWLALVIGAVDLARFGWFFAEPGSIFVAKPWRLLSYWGIAPLFLVLLGRPGVSAWVGVDTEVEQKAKQDAGGAPR